MEERAGVEPSLLLWNQRWRGAEGRSNPPPLTRVNVERAREVLSNRPSPPSKPVKVKEGRWLQPSLHLWKPVIVEQRGSVTTLCPPLEILQKVKGRAADPNPLTPLAHSCRAFKLCDQVAEPQRACAGAAPKCNGLKTSSRSCKGFERRSARRCTRSLMGDRIIYTTSTGKQNKKK